VDDCPGTIPVLLEMTCRLAGDCVGVFSQLLVS